MEKKTTRILVVDDDADLLRLYSEVLRAEGYEVEQATTARQGIEAARRHCPHLVLLDVRLPDLSGIEVCRRLKAEPALADLFIALISGETPDSAQRVAGLAAGAEDFISKLTPPGELLARIRMLARLRDTAAALRESVEQYRQLAENISEVFWMTDVAKQRMIYVSPAYEAIWGRSCVSLYASPRDWGEAIHPQDRDRVLKAALTRQASGGYNEEYRIVRPDGTLRWVQDRAFPVRDESGAVYRVVGIAQDITLRKQAEQALLQAMAERQRAEQHLTEALSFNETILAASTVGIQVFRNTGECIFANGAAGRILGATLGRLIAQNFRDLPSWKTSGLLAMADKALRTHQPVTGEVQKRTESGRELWVDCQMMAFHNLGELHLLVLQLDTTHRKRLEEELHRLPQRILEAQEVERQRVARELHDSVNQLLASARMRLRRVETTLRPARPSLAEILARSGELLVQALDENRRIAHDLRPSDLDELGFAVACRNFCRQFAARTGLAVRCEVTRLGRSLTPAMKLHLFRIVQEAFKNAEHHARARNIRIRLVRQDTGLLLTIRDNGRGFDAGSGRTRRRGRRGMGLTNIRERAALMGGTCELETVPGQGTTLRVRVPLERG